MKNNDAENPVVSVLTFGEGTSHEEAHKALETLRAEFKKSGRPGRIAFLPEEAPALRQEILSQVMIKLGRATELPARARIDVILGDDMPYAVTKINDALTQLLEYEGDIQEIMKSRYFKSIVATRGMTEAKLRQQTFSVSATSQKIFIDSKSHDYLAMVRKLEGRIAADEKAEAPAKPKREPKTAPKIEAPKREDLLAELIGKLDTDLASAGVIIERYKTSVETEVHEHMRLNRDIKTVGEDVGLEKEILREAIDLLAQQTLLNQQFRAALGNEAGKILKPTGLEATLKMPTRTSATPSFAHASGAPVQFTLPHTGEHAGNADIVDRLERLSAANHDIAGFNTWVERLKGENAALGEKLFKLHEEGRWIREQSQYKAAQRQILILENAQLEFAIPPQEAAIA